MYWLLSAYPLYFELAFLGVYLNPFASADVFRHLYNQSAESGSLVRDVRGAFNRWVVSTTEALRSLANLTLLALYRQ